MISPAEALALLLGAARPLPAVTLPLERAQSLALARPLKARGDLPRLDVSAVDGFALRGDCRPGAAWPLGPAIAAGMPRVRLLPGLARPIYTGAPVPLGADRVLPQEWGRAEDGILRVIRTAGRAAGPGANIRRRGEELRRGAVGLPAGAPLSPERVGFAAALGHGAVPVRPRPRVGLLVGGDELRPAGAALKDGQIWDVNGPLLRAWLARRGLAPRSFKVGDQPRALRLALGMALHSCDLLLCSGGASVGARDHLKPALKALGVRTLFWGVAQKPGKPLYAGRKGRTLVLGLPGNPAAVALGLAYYAAPLLAALQGLPAPLPERLPAAQALEGDGHKTLFLKARRQGGAVRPLGAQGSHMLSSLGQADGWLELPPAGLKRGQAAALWPL
jgi:molybdopterin molybdotransferase